MSRKRTLGELTVAAPPPPPGLLDLPNEVLRMIVCFLLPSQRRSTCATIGGSASVPCGLAFVCRRFRELCERETRHLVITPYCATLTAEQIIDKIRRCVALRSLRFVNLFISCKQVLENLFDAINAAPHLTTLALQPARHKNYGFMPFHLLKRIRILIVNYNPRSQESAMVNGVRVSRGQARVVARSMQFTEECYAYSTDPRIWLDAERDSHGSYDVMAAGDLKMPSALGFFSAPVHWTCSPMVSVSAIGAALRISRVHAANPRLAFDERQNASPSDVVLVPDVNHLAVHDLLRFLSEPREKELPSNVPCTVVLVNSDSLQLSVAFHPNQNPGPMPTFWSTRTTPYDITVRIRFAQSARWLSNILRCVDAFCVVSSFEARVATDDMDPFPVDLRHIKRLLLYGSTIHIANLVKSITVTGPDVLMVLVEWSAFRVLKLHKLPPNVVLWPTEWSENEVVF